jgi:hypothetical protein
MAQLREVMKHAKKPVLGPTQAESKRTKAAVTPGVGVTCKEVATVTCRVP